MSITCSTFTTISSLRHSPLSRSPTSFTDLATDQPKVAAVVTARPNTAMMARKRKRSITVFTVGS